MNITGLSIGYTHRPVLSDLNLSASEGELVALVGRNGVGKSTLIRTIARLQPAISGNISIDGKPLSKYQGKDLAGLLSIVSTETVGISHLTVRQLVAYGRFPYTNWIGRMTEEDTVAVKDAMQLVGISHLADKNLYETSDGERQRAMIARSLAQDTAIILLDEPTAFLDMPTKYEVIRLLHRMTREKRKTIIFSTHDLNIAMHEADKLWLTVGDRLYEGAPEDLVLCGQFERVFEGTGLQFDDNKGEFSIRRVDTHPVRLTGNGKNHFWTREALERTGYTVDNRMTDNPDIISIIISETLPVYWTLTSHGHNKRFDSIYDMIQYLMSK